MIALQIVSVLPGIQFAYLYNNYEMNEDGSCKYGFYNITLRK